MRLARHINDVQMYLNIRWMPVGIAPYQDNLFDVNSIVVIAQGLTVWCSATYLACRWKILLEECTTPSDIVNPPTKQFSTVSKIVKCVSHLATSHVHGMVTYAYLNNSGMASKSDDGFYLLWQYWVPWSAPSLWSHYRETHMAAWRHPCFISPK